jgi:hypothetical protein
MRHQRSLRKQWAYTTNSYSKSSALKLIGNSLSKSMLCSKPQQRRQFQRPSIQATLSGTGGTNVTWWLQTSIDGGQTWCDALAAVFVAAGRLNGIVLSGPAAGVAPVAPSDGGGTPPFVVNGMFGGYWRVKFSSTGTWVAGNLGIDSFGQDIEPSTG